MIHIVILELENNCFFIGKTNDILFNMNKYNRNLNDFTIKNKPIKIHEFKENCNIYELDITVKIYMNKYGINNVRGGSYSDLMLSKEQVNILEKELKIINTNNLDNDLNNNLDNDLNNNDIHNIIFINNSLLKKPVITNNYIWYWGCSICNKNAVGTIECSNFNFAITVPTYLDKNKNIDKIAICDICLKKLKLDNFNNQKVLIDSNNNNKYLIKGFENGQYI